MRKRLGASGGILVLACLVIAAASAFGLARNSNDRVTAALQRWTFAAKMPHRRSYTASAKVAGKVYVAAGMVGNTGRPLDVFERFDPARNEWRSLKPVPKAFSAAAGAGLAGRVYVIGGNSKQANGRQVFSYDVRRDRWASLAPLPARRTNLAAVGLGGKVYALGGLDPFSPTRSAFEYDPETNSWARAAPLPRALHGLAAVAFHGELWMLGGRDKAGKVSRLVWIYNPRQDRWRAGPTMPVPMEIHGAEVVGERIYTVLESTTLVYDATTSRWSRGPSLQVPRHALALFAADGKLFAIGGCIVPQLEDSQVVESLDLSS